MGCLRKDIYRKFLHGSEWMDDGDTKANMLAMVGRLTLH